VQSVSTVITSWTAATPSVEFPFVTLPNFEQVAHDALQQSGAELIAWLPIVTKAELTAFERYSTEHQGWIVDALKFEGNETAKATNTSFEITPWPNSNIAQGEFEARDYFVPLWQAGPASLTSSLTLVDFLTHPKLGFVLEEVMSTRHSILSSLVDLGFHSDEPRSIIFEPVFDKFGDTAPENSLQLVVGFVAAVIPWRVYFEDELPDGVNGINIHVSNTCGQEFTYGKHVIACVDDLLSRARH
jgi:CHASE domain